MIAATAAQTLLAVLDIPNKPSRIKTFAPKNIVTGPKINIIVYWKIVEKILFSLCCSIIVNLLLLHAKYKHPDKRRRTPDKIESVKKPKVNIDKDKNDEDSFDDEDGIELSDEVLSMAMDQVESDEKSNSNSNTNTNINENSNTKSLITLDDKKIFIKEKFMVDMPDDFYQFWDLCVKMKKDCPKDAFKDIGLSLVGPFDVLDESFRVGDATDDKYLLHWRYYYDPPEFQTIIKGNDQSGFHMGYFRDVPEDNPIFVGSNEANKNCIIEPIGGNIFGAINTYIEKMLKTADPFKKMSISKLHKSLTTEAKELKLNLSKSTPEMEARHRKTVCKSFHQAGIVVPYNRKTEIGYRKLPVSEKELRKILMQIPLLYEDNKEKAFTSLHPVLTAATIANDECDFGTGLELGINLFCQGSECLNNTALNVLCTTYMLLNRHAFRRIADVHFKNRKKGMPYVLGSQ